ncbi:MAG TPA: SusE domain-containing protein [Ferruginibacter sp.]|nr:SusE domain-containing protein [Ferruginibacter sp.]HRE62335.1 SusE domain-containing protein [Ferruginibacter sp.]
MKNILKTLLVLVTGAAMLYSCKKDENQVLFQGGTAPVLSASTASISLGFITQTDRAVLLNWTNPDYNFNTGISSQDVSYTFEIDTVGANFTNPKKQQVTIANNLSFDLTQGQLNDYLLNQLELKPAMPHQIEMRIISSIGGVEATKLISNKLTYTITPYAIPPKVDPPASGELYMVGSATPGGWNNPVPSPAQKFTKVSETLYELTVDISPGGSYLFLPVNGSWSAKYGFIGSNNTNNVNGDDFKAEGGDMLAPSTSGSHKIVVDFQRGKWTITKL